VASNRHLRNAAGGVGQSAVTAGEKPALIRPVAASGVVPPAPHSPLAQPAAEVEPFPRRLGPEQFYPQAYRQMFTSRRMEERLFELFQKGYAKGTVAVGIGNEAVAVGMALPLRPGRDVVSVMHRDFAVHLLFGSPLYDLFCQYLANEDSPTHAREGNVHHGDARGRRFPMMSHLGKMLSLAVGGTWAARQAGEPVFGLAVIGDGGTSTGEFHEALNIASVFHVPVLFVIENNHYAFSTPTSAQYHCRQLSDRAEGYGIQGLTLDGTDVWQVYCTVCDALEAMAAEPAPRLLECDTLRLRGHVAYDKAAYVSRRQMESWQRRDPLPKTRRVLLENGLSSEAEISRMEQQIDEEIHRAMNAALKAARPPKPVRGLPVFARGGPSRVEPFRAPKLKNGEAVNRALVYVLDREPRAFLAGLDVGTYGSAFKTCKGLIDRFGPERVIDMPLCESGAVGFALGASQTGARPIFEFQFADFSTEACTQLGLNAGTWFFRSGCEAPLLVRLPCGGGLTLGAFHSGEFEGLWSRFPGVKLLYPATAGETFEALVAGFYDPNPCLVFEHKLLYWSKTGEIDFDGDLNAVWRARKYTEGTDLTLVAMGAMVHEALDAAGRTKHSIEVINPFVLQPLEIEPIVESVRKTGRLLVVQESGSTHGLGDRIISLVAQACLGAIQCPPRLIASPDGPVPFAPELEFHARPDRGKILAAIEQMCG